MLKPHDRLTAERCVKQALECLGHSIEGEELKDTPARVIKFWEYFTHRSKPKLTVFPTDSEGLIVETGIPVASLCSHHLAPFFGYATVGYLPGKQMYGLSKLPRIVDYHARSFQNQERLTRAIAEEVAKHVNPRGVGVILCCEHTCMTIRGVRAHGVRTTTTELLGAIKTDPTARAEFLAHHKHY